MAERNLRLVGSDDIYQLDCRPERLSERVRRMHRQAQMLACEEVDQLRGTLDQATAIADSPALFPSGVREQARRLVDNLPQVMRTLQALSDRRLGELLDGPAPPVWRRP